jgi:hypothetical protein
MRPEQRIIIEQVSDPIWLQIVIPLVVAAVIGFVGYTFRRKK